MAGARAGWWRWLIAALVASLVSVPVAGAAAPIGRAPAAGGHQRGPLARATQAQSVAVAIVVELAKGALNKAGSAGFGWVLDQFGLGDGLEGEIGGIRDRLGEIQNHLTALEAAVTQLRAEVAESEYSDLVGANGPRSPRTSTMRGEGWTHRAHDQKRQHRYAEGQLHPGDADVHPQQADGERAGAAREENQR